MVFREGVDGVQPSMGEAQSMVVQERLWCVGGSRVHAQCLPVAGATRPRRMRTASAPGNSRYHPRLRAGRAVLAASLGVHEVIGSMSPVWPVWSVSRAAPSAAPMPVGRCLQFQVERSPRTPLAAGRTAAACWPHSEPARHRSTQRGMRSTTILRLAGRRSRAMARTALSLATTPMTLVTPSFGHRTRTESARRERRRPGAVAVCRLDFGALGGAW